MIAVLSLILSLFTVALLVRAVLSWIPNHNSTLAAVNSFVFNVTEPVLAPVRKVVPPMAGIDTSFLAVIIGIMIVRAVFLH